MSEFREIGEYVRSLPWHMRLRIWWAGLWLKHDLRTGKLKITNHVICFDCLHPINPHDDDACVCINCGGRNRRLTANGATND